jgi:CIC family chloride channel protein
VVLLAGVAAMLHSGPRERLTLIAAGAGAGLASAFNAPLAGLIFVLEELQRDFRPTVFSAAFVAAVVGNVVSRLFTGQLPVFIVPDHSIQPLHTLAMFAALGVVCGLVGVLFNKALVGGLSLVDRLNQLQKLFYTAVIGAIVALAGFWYPEFIGGGHRFTEHILLGQIGMQSVLGFLTMRMLLTLASYSTGAPGGIFAPLLVLGALIGYGACVIVWI